MNGKKAKAIRNTIYGDFSTRDTKYMRHTDTHVIICAGLRKEYKELKKLYRENRNDFKTQIKNGKTILTEKWNTVY